MSNSKRISQFNSDSLLQDGDLFTLVRNNTNLNIRYSDFKTDLGVTGSISQTGDPLGAPVLYDAGNSNYYIRNLESSKGIAVTVSAQNGVNIATDFAQIGNGQKVIKDISADQLEFKTLVGGSNINITSDDDTLTFNFIPSGGASKTVTISEESDFPDPVAGVITLENDTDYLLVNDITTANRFIAARPNSIRGASSQMVELAYTGTGTMFSGDSVSLKFFNVTISAPSGHIFNTTATGAPGIVQMVECNVRECETLGNIDSNFITRFTNVAFENIKTNGLTFSGTNEILVIDVGVAFIYGGSLIDFGTSTFNAVTIESSILQESAVGTFFLSGLPNSGNINAGGLATVINNKGFGSGTALSGVNQNDARWEFFGNNLTPDSLADGMISVVGSTTETIITTQGVKVKVNNVWTEEVSARFDFDSSGRLTYNGERPIRLPVGLTTTVLFAAGTDKQADVCIAINGSVITQTTKQGTASSTKAASITTIWQHEFLPGDYVEVFTSNETNTENIIVQQAVLRIN